MSVSGLSVVELILLGFGMLMPVSGCHACRLSLAREDAADVTLRTVWEAAKPATLRPKLSTSP